MKPRAKDIVAQSARIGTRIRTYRKFRSLSQGDLARDVGLSRMQIHRIESDGRVLSVLEAMRIARSLGLTMEQLVGSVTEGEP